MVDAMFTFPFGGRRVDRTLYCEGICKIHGKVTGYRQEAGWIPKTDQRWFCCECDNTDVVTELTDVIPDVK
jgi:hypothetical protein